MSIHLLRTELGVLQLKIDTLLPDLGSYCSTPRPLYCLQWDLEQSLFTIHSCQSPMVLLLDLPQLKSIFSYAFFKNIPEQHSIITSLITSTHTINSMHTMLLYFTSVFRNHKAGT